MFNLRIFLYAVLACGIAFLSLFSWSAYSYYGAIHADDPIDPILLVDDGSAKIIRWDTAYHLVKDESYELEDGDKVETARASRATITWPDKSVTRMGADTRIVIRKMFASERYDDIRIAYDMERGKVWNTIIRTLIGDSYFEVNLPRESVVAWVRGTTFEVNLEKKYIHAVDHMTTLRDRSKRSLHLLSWELVDSENIWVKKWREWLDSAWNDWNIIGDATYRKIRSLDIERRLTGLTGSGRLGIDTINRALLSKVKWFENLEIARLMKSWDAEALKKYSSETLLDFYQKIPDITKSEDRERLRKLIISDTTDAKLRESLNIHALWESLDAWSLSDRASQYLKSKWVDTAGLWGKVLEWAKTDTKKLLESLSGSLERIMGF
jgi:hypothetical protein